MSAEHSLDLNAVSQSISLLPPELETRALNKRFEPWEKRILADQLYNLRFAFPECRLNNNAPFNLQIDSIFTQYADFEFTLLPQENEIERLLKESGSLHIVGRAQTANEILSVSNLLSLLRNSGRYAPTTFITSYFPLQRGDRYQRQILTPENRQALAYNGQPVSIWKNEKNTSFIEMMPLIELITILKLRGVNRIIQIDSHSPAFAYHALKEGVHVVDLSAIPLMLNAANKEGLLSKTETYSPVVGDDGAREMGLLGHDLLVYFGFKTLDLLQGEKRKSLTAKEIYFDPNKLKEISGTTAVIFEDIISTGGTMLETYKILIKAGAEKVIILATHPIFAKEALNNLNQDNLYIVTTDSRIPLKDISEANNVINVPLLSSLDKLASYDQNHGDYWGSLGQRFLEENELVLAPWQTHHSIKD